MFQTISTLIFIGYASLIGMGHLENYKGYKTTDSAKAEFLMCLKRNSTKDGLFGTGHIQCLQKYNEQRAK